MSTQKTIKENKSRAGLFLKISLLAVPCLYGIYFSMAAVRENISWTAYVFEDPGNTALLLSAFVSVLWFLLYQQADTTKSSVDRRQVLMGILAGSLLVGNLLSAGLSFLVCRQMPRQTAGKKFQVRRLHPGVLVLELLAAFCSFAFLRLAFLT